ncbi:MAG: hypothetical protein ACK5JJ_06865 [Cyanobacteriota bacterium]|jgi:hypothetical protein
MSNDLIKSIQSNLAALQTGLDEDTAAVAGGGGFVKRISIKGGVFRKMSGGKEVGKNEDRHMNIIFVKMAHDPSRTYYAQSYREGEKISPTCWSSNSKTPDAEVKNPQAAACDKCPHSVKGSGQGGTGSACRLSWRTAVVLPNDISGDIMQLVLPATSCFGKEDGGRWPFRPYIQMLASNNISAGRVVTKMQFDTSSPVPKVMFSPVAAVDPDDVAEIQRQAKSPMAETCVKMNVYQADEAAAPASRAPVAEPEAPPVYDDGAGESAPEPTLRESKKPEAAASADVPDIIKKWSKKA